MRQKPVRVSYSIPPPLANSTALPQARNAAKLSFKSKADAHHEPKGFRRNHRLPVLPIHLFD